MNRFNLEDQIQACWNTKDDIDILVDFIASGSLSNDKICDILIGLSQLHEIRCQRVFDTFSYLIKKGDIS